MKYKTLLRILLASSVPYLALACSLADSVVAPDGAKAYVCCYSDPNKISVVDTASNAIMYDIADASNCLDTPSSIAFTPDGSRAYVVSVGNSSVCMIDVVSDSVVAQIMVATFVGILSDIIVSSDGNFAYVVIQDGGAGLVGIIDTNSNSGTYNTFIGNIYDPANSFRSPAAMAIAQDGLKGYVVNSGNNSVSVVDLDATSSRYWQVAGLVKDLESSTFNHPETIVFAENGLTAYVGNRAWDKVSVIDVSLDEVVATTSGSADQDISVYMAKHLSSKLLQSVATRTAAPVVNPQALSLVVNSVNNAITLTGTDPLGQALTFDVPATSAHGILTQASAGSSHLTYTPLNGYVGQDAFMFTATNTLGQTSAPAVITITLSDIPTANAASVTFAVNSSNNGITLTGTDTLGDTFTFALGSSAGPSHGTISGFNPFSGMLTYTPNSGYVGQDLFTFTVTNAAGISSTPGVVRITIVGTPVANAQSANVGVNSTNNVIALTGSDPLGLAFTFALGNGTGTSHGVITAFNASTGVLTYVPTAGYAGQDTFMFTVTNSAGIISAPAKVTIAVIDTPLAVSRSANVGVNSINNAITLTGTDPLGQSLSFALAVSPSHGTVTGFNSSTGVAIYTPNNGYVGVDSFTFMVRNTPYGNTSTPATVTINVIDTPLSNGQSVTFGVNSRNNIMILSGSDPLGQTLRFVLGNGTGPSHGTVSILNPATGVVTYTPTVGYIGQDSFTFTVTNSNGITSAQSTVSITLINAPIANSRTTNVGVNTLNNVITLTGVDPLGQPFKFALGSGTGTSHGTLSAFNATTGVVSYTPNAGYVGQDSFTFVIKNSAGNTSAPATVVIEVINSPIATARVASVGVNSVNNPITLTGSDPLGQAVTFALAASPSHGTVSVVNPATGLVTYTPTNGYVGQDSFTFTVKNASGIISAPAAVTITVANTPFANSESVSVAVNSASNSIVLTGTDPLGQVIRFALETGTGVTHGVLSGLNATTGVVTYTPTPGYVGQDLFMFTVTNTNGVVSAPATVTIAVIDVPVANARASSVVVNSINNAITLTGTDPLSQPFTFALAANPSHGIVSVVNPATGIVNYSPTAGYAGLDLFTFTVTNNNGITSSPAAVTVTVANTPVANDRSVRFAVNSANNAITLTGSDPLSQPLTFAIGIGNGPSNGTLLGFNAATGAILYTPNNQFTGTDSFAFIVTNTSGIVSAQAVVTITIQ